MNRFNNLKNTEKGLALLEFTMVLPFLLLMVMVAAEAGRAINTIESATQYSREAANLAYRQCLDLDRGSARFCLMSVQTTVQNYARRYAPDTKIELAIYPIEALDNPRLVIRARPTSMGSKFSIQNRQFVGPLRTNTLTTNGVIIVSEAWVPFETTIEWIDALVFKFSRDHLYDAAVF